MTFAVKEKDFRPYSIPKNDFISYVFDNNYYICQYKQVKQKDMNYYELTSPTTLLSRLPSLTTYWPPNWEKSALKVLPKTKTDC